MRLKTIRCLIKFKLSVLSGTWNSPLRQMQQYSADLKDGNLWWKYGDVLWSPESGTWLTLLEELNKNRTTNLDKSTETSTSEQWTGLQRQQATRPHAQPCSKKAYCNFPVAHQQRHFNNSSEGFVKATEKG